MEIKDECLFQHTSNQNDFFFHLGSFLKEEKGLFQDISHGAVMGRARELKKKNPKKQKPTNKTSVDLGDTSMNKKEAFIHTVTRRGLHLARRLSF